MADMIFFTKHECSNSQNQKKALLRAGNRLHCHDILTCTWTRETLLPYVRGRKPLEILDCRAPEIRSGKLDPLLLTWEEALALMLSSPALIKGPLVQVDDLHIQGCDDTRLQRYLEPAPRKEQRSSSSNGSLRFHSRLRSPHRYSPSAAACPA